MMRRILLWGFFSFLIIAPFAIPGLMSLDGEVQNESYRGAFVPGNRDKEILQFVAGGHVLGFRKGDMFIATGDHALKVEFVNARPVSPADEGVPPDTENDRKVAQPLGRVIYRDLWNGVTLVYEKHTSGVVKSTYTVQPAETGIGSSVDRIRLRYNVPVEVDEGGNLVFSFEAGQMKESRPLAWQEIDGKQIPVDVSFRSFGKQEAGFNVGGYDPNFPLVIDPVIIWNTFISAAGTAHANAIVVDSSGNAYVAGSRSQCISGGHHCFTTAYAAKLNSSGERQWLVSMGSLEIEAVTSCNAMALDSSGNIYVAGSCNYSWGTPVNPHNGNYQSDAFIAKLNNSGALQWHTFLGSGYYDHGQAIAVEASGNIYVAGWSEGTWGSPVNPYSEDRDAFVVKLNNSGVLQWNTFMGANGNDSGNAIALDGSGNIYVAGVSNATWGSPANPHSGSADAFVAKLSNSGARLWNTFMGSGSADYGYAIAVDAGGYVYVAGYSGDWGTPVNPHAGSSDAFVARLNTNGALQWNTFMGSPDRDGAFGLAMDSSGNIYLAGDSLAGWGMPIDPFQENSDAFVAKLNNSGVHQCHTFIGGAGYDYGHSTAVDTSGNVYVAGDSSTSWGTPVDPGDGSRDAFIAKIRGPDITVTSPNGGEAWPVGSTHDITWTTGLLGRMRIELSTDDGSNWTPIINSTENDESHPWTVTYPISSQCLVRISEIDGSPSDISDATFSTILPPSITVTSPNGGENWYAGSTHNITWIQTSLTGQVTIDLYKGGSLYEAIGTAAVSAGTYSWPIPLTLTEGMDYKVRIYQGAVEDYSDNDFSILQEMVAISGTVRRGASGLAGVMMVGLTGNPLTDAAGYYEAAVPLGWSGRVSPYKAGYLFSPECRRYTTVTSDKPGEDYSGTESECRFLRSGSWTGAGYGSDGWYEGDFNGDGMEDIFRYRPGVSGADVFLSAGAGFYFSGSWTMAGHGSDGWHVGDFNGDGMDDIFRVVVGVSGADVFLSNGMRFYRSGSWTMAGHGSDGWHVGDFNGDGMDDIFRVVVGVSGADVFLSSGVGFYRSGSWTGAGYGSDGWYVGDFNGDGMDDIFRYVPGSSGADVFLSTGASFYRSGSWTGAGHGSDGWYVGDFNGDGRDDIFRYLPGMSGADVFLSDGTQFVYAGSWTGAGHGSDGWHVGDFNGDGRGDIFRVLVGVSGADVFLSYCVSPSAFSIAFKESILALDEDMMLDVYGMRETEMSYLEEVEFLAPFMENAMMGEDISIYEIKKAYERAVAHPVRLVTIRQLLERHSFWDLEGGAHQNK
jgi:hypothetical protein